MSINIVVREKPRPALGPTQPPIQQVPGYLPEKKRLWCEFDDSLQLAPKLKMSGVMFLVPLFASMSSIGTTLNFSFFWARSQNCEKRLLALSCLSVFRMEQLGSYWTDFH
jgi:hypothetical protein